MRILPLFALLALSMSVWADDIKVADLPANVKATMEKVTKGAELTQVQKNTVDGKTVFSAKYDKKGKEATVKVGEDGVVIGRKNKKAE